MDNKVEDEKINIKTKKVGRFTFGFILILIGIAIFIGTVTNIDMIRYIMMLSPLIFISLGIEIIIASKNNEIKYDIIGIILIFLSLGTGWVCCGVNYFVNKVLYDDEVKDAISDNLGDYNCMYYFDDEISLINTTDTKFAVKVIEDSSVEETACYIKYKYNGSGNKQNNNLISKLINQDEKYLLTRVDYGASNVTIFEDDERYTDVEIKILTNNKENVKINGNFELEEN